MRLFLREEAFFIGSVKEEKKETPRHLNAIKLSLIDTFSFSLIVI